ncbi:MAG: hemolysin family protein [Eubacteriales bacterium]
MPSDPIWFLLLVASAGLNIALFLRKPLTNRLSKPKGEMMEEKILAMVEEGEEEGSIKASEKELIENILEFNDLTAEDVMIHRRDVIMIGQKEDHEKVMEMIATSGLSRFPVYNTDADDIVGVLSTREYLLNYHAPEKKTIEELMRPAFFVPQRVAAEKLLRDMQSKKNHFAIVVDEYGGVGGIVTLEDLLEEIVGNIYDEFDPQAQLEIIPLEENLWRVSGGTDLEELAEVLGLTLPDEELDFDTVGGLVFDQLAMIPEDGSHPVVDGLGLHIQVEEMQERRILWVLISRLDPRKPSLEKPEKEIKS